ncbi:MAG: NAD(P)-binding domain-containing protein, partial [Shewanella sp.]
MTLAPSVSVIGCGWFGLPLAKALLSQGYRVKGSKRTQDGVESLAGLGIEAFRFDLEDEAPLPASLLDAQVVVINIPPGFKGGD